LEKEFFIYYEKDEFSEKAWQKGVKMKTRDWIISITLGVILGVILGFSRIGDGLKIIPVNAEDSNNYKRNLMLNSHSTWKTIKGTATISMINPRDDKQEQFVNIIEANNSDQGKLNVYDQSGQEILFWLANGTKIIESDENIDNQQTFQQPNGQYFLDLLPNDISSIDNETVIRHPMATIIPSPIGDYIYSTGLAQRTGDYDWLGEEKLLNRATWILEYIKQNDTGDTTMHARYWVDQNTGIILKAQIFSTEFDTFGKIIESIEFTNIEFDGPIDIIAN
jgi:hypothetical protein